MRKLAYETNLISALIILSLIFTSCGDNTNGPEREPGIYLWGEYTAPGFINVIAGDSNGSYAYICVGNYGAQIIDRSQADSLFVTGDVGIFNFAFDMDAEGNFLYLADGPDGLKVIDVSHPNQPGLAGELNLSGTAWSICVDDDYAYVANGLGVIQIIDISSAIAPELLNVIDGDGEIQLATIDDRRLYTADYLNTLKIYDVQDPVSPELLGSLTLSQMPSDLAAKDSYCYLAIANRLEVVDASDPANPIVVDDLELEFAPRFISLDNSYAYVTHEVELFCGFYVIDISDPENVRLENRYTHEGDSGDIFARDNFVYWAVDSTLVLLEHVP